jgi:hypothetical protein
MGPHQHAGGLHMLVDIPNVTNSLRDVSRKREGDFTAFDRTRLSLRNLYRLAHADRRVAGSLWAGLDRPSVRWLPGAIRAFAPDAEIDLRQPGYEDDREQQITDLVLAQRMARLLDHRPGLLVLVTGDGAGWACGDGMFAAAQRLAGHGWAVEVLAWADSLNRHLAAWASRPPHALVELDAFYRPITYIEGGRGSGTLDLTQRPQGVPPLDNAA